MSRTLTPRDALERIDGWSSASIEEFDGGLTNRVFLVTSGSRRGVLKVDHEARGEPFSPRPFEARIQQTAHEKGLAPAVIYSDERCYLTEYVDGVVFTPEIFNSSDELERLGKSLRELHALPRSGRTFDARGAAHIYAESINKRDPDEVRDRVAIIDAMPGPSALCLCHNDLVAENIIDTGKVMFLDWEYACDNDPLFDVATIVAHHDLDETQTDALLTAYFDGEWNTWHSSLERQVEFYLALLWLWRNASLPAVAQLP